MKKILIVSTVSRQFYLFEKGNIEVLKSLGYEVHAAANFSDANERLDALDIVRHPFDIQRSPFSIKNIKAYKQLKKILKSEKFSAVHCHSPMGGVLARLAAKSVVISPVIYTVHGFHFYKGAPYINWLIYYPVEKFLSSLTKVLITINQEDYHRAREFNANTFVYVPGVGINTRNFFANTSDKANKRKEMSIPTRAFVILSVGELNKNKNHEVIIKGLAKINDPNVYYLICGQGSRENYLRQLIISLGLSDRVKLLGFRNDVSEIYSAADIFAFPSYREGLSVSLMEAMASGLPVVCTNVRGNVDLVEDRKGGYLIEPNDVSGFANAINLLVKNSTLRNKLGSYNLEKIKDFDEESVKQKMKIIYQNELL